MAPSSSLATLSGSQGTSLSQPNSNQLTQNCFMVQGHLVLRSFPPLLPRSLVLSQANLTCKQQRSPSQPQVAPLCVRRSMPHPRSRNRNRRCQKGSQNRSPLAAEPVNPLLLREMIRTTIQEGMRTSVTCFQSLSKVGIYLHLRERRNRDPNRSRNGMDLFKSLSIP